MSASREARFAPIGALRGGLTLLVVGMLLAWGPLGDVPTWIWGTLLAAGAVLVAVAMGIRTLRM